MLILMEQYMGCELALSDTPSCCIWQSYYQVPNNAQGPTTYPI